LFFGFDRVTILKQEDPSGPKTSTLEFQAQSRDSTEIHTTNSLGNDCRLTISKLPTTYCEL